MIQRTGPGGRTNRRVTTATARTPAESAQTCVCGISGTHSLALVGERGIGALTVCSGCCRVLAWSSTTAPTVSRDLA